MQILIVFLMMLATDILWTFYIRRTNEGRALQAATMSLFLMLIGGFVVVSYTENHWMLLPAAGGSFLGTYITVRWETRTKKEI